VKLPRRRFLQVATALAALPWRARRAEAQSYPARPVRIMVGFAPGGPTDIAARLIGHWLSQRLGQPFLVDNRPGAGGNIATEAVVNARPDGYTLLLVNAANAISASLYPDLKFVFVRDIAPVAAFVRVPNVLEVHPSVPAKTVGEFIAYARANPGRINMAGVNGTTLQLAGELFKIKVGLDMPHVSYKGAAPALADLLAGRVQVLFDNLSSSIEHIRAGRLRALAVTTATRSKALPDVPTLNEFVPGYEASAWHGIGAPKEAPLNIVETLNREINAAFVDSEMTARISELGGIEVPGSAADFGKLIADDTVKWGAAVRSSGAKPD
jgi:tripartite-type tricarboxylate transporter receptor subunit TctC